MTAARRTFTEVQELFRRLGRDLQLSWAGTAGSFDDSDLAVSRTVVPGSGGGTRTDLGVARDVDQGAQFLVNRLMTRRGELAVLGHPEYGSRHHELVGEPNTERTRNLVKLYILQAMRDEPRVAKVIRCSVVSHPFERDVVRVEMQIRLIDGPAPLNLVVPVELGGAA